VTPVFKFIQESVGYKKTDRLEWLTYPGSLTLKEKAGFSLIIG
jgi:hypothetical protein